MFNTDLLHLRVQRFQPEPVLKPTGMHIQGEWVNPAKWVGSAGLFLLYKIRIHLLWLSHEFILASTGGISYFVFENVENPSLLDDHYSRDINIFWKID